MTDNELELVDALINFSKIMNSMNIMFDETNWEDFTPREKDMLLSIEAQCQLFVNMMRIIVDRPCTDCGV